MGYTVGHRWSKEEEQFLKDNYIQRTTKKLSIEMGISENAIEHKLNRLGLKRPQDIVRKRVTEASIRATRKEKVILKCVECGKQLPPLLPCFAKVRKFCSKSCGSRYLNKNISTELREYRRGFGVRVAKNPKRLEEIRKLAQKEDWLKGRTGEKNPHWKGGISFEPYTQEFNKQLKIYIHKLWQDNCFLCKETKDLTVHHINYNKKNSSIYNLVTLCRACNSRVNSGREYWQKYLHGICWGSPEEKKAAELMYKNNTKYNKNYVQKLAN